MTQFEYMTITKDPSIAGAREEIAMLDEFGREGWLMVTVRQIHSGQGLKLLDLYYFGRPKED